MTRATRQDFFRHFTRVYSGALAREERKRETGKRQHAGARAEWGGKGRGAAAAILFTAMWSSLLCRAGDASQWLSAICAAVKEAPSWSALDDYLYEMLWVRWHRVLIPGVLTRVHSVFAFLWTPFILQLRGRRSGHDKRTGLAAL